MLFVETPYTLATEEAERIGVDHVARLSNTGTVDSSTGTFYILLYNLVYLFSMQRKKDDFDLIFQWLIQWLFFCFLVSEHLLAQYNAIKMLHSRVKMILEYAKAVKNGNTHSLLLCAWRKMPTTLNLSLVIVKSFHNLFLFFFFSGEAPCNHEIMRDALSLIQRLPVMKTDLFREDFYNVGWLSFYKVLCVVVNPLIPNIQLSILPFGCYTFLC